MVFLELHREPGIYSHVMERMDFQSPVCSATSGLLSTCEGQIGILLDASKHNRVSCQGELEAQGPFLPATGILGFLSIFKRSQLSSNFEASISP